MRPGQDRGSKGRGRCLRRQIGDRMVPLAGIEPALLAELDFESSASTNSATGAFATAGALEVAKPAEYSGRAVPVNPRGLRRNGRRGCALASQNTPV